MYRLYNSLEKTTKSIFKKNNNKKPSKEKSGHYKKIKSNIYRGSR